MRYPIALGWVVAAVVATVTLPGLGSASEQGIGSLAPPGSDAIAAEKAELRHFSFPLISRTMVIQRDPDGLSPAPQRRTIAKDVRITANQPPPLRFLGIRGVLPISNGVPLLSFAREEGTAVLSYLFMSPNLSPGDNVKAATSLANWQRAHGAGTEVNVTGSIPTEVERSDVISGNLIWLDVATVLLVLVIVGLYFRAVAPPLVTLATVAIAFLVAFRVVAWVAMRLGLQVSSDLEPIMTVLLFGVITDYSIFFIARFRVLVREGEAPNPAARRCVGELLPVVGAAGGVIALSTAALYLAQLGFLRGVGPGLAVTILVAVLVSVTFVPAVIAILGRLLLWPHPPRREGEGSRLGARAVRLASARPLPVAAACLVLLGGCATGVAYLRTQDAEMAGLPPSAPAHRGFVDVSRAFVPGLAAPTLVLVRGHDLIQRRPDLVHLQRLLRRQPDVAGVVGPGDNPWPKPQGAVLAEDGSTARYAVIFRSDPLAAPAIQALRSIESRLPSLLQDAHITGATASVGGDTALTAETADGLRGDLGRLAPIVLGVILVMLALLLRALVAPLYLVAVSVLGLLAALGLTTYFFQDILGYPGISLFVPITIAVLLLSLGSDYNVFLVSRIWQEARTRALREAIAVAGGRSARAISVAGVALAGSFAAAAVIPLTSFREIAFGMAVGLLIDAFIVRALLVPALINLVGPASAWPRKRPGGELADAAKASTGEVR